jgi:ATP-dependent helicase/DNAse subunit B
MNRVSKPLRMSPSSLDVFFKCSMQYKWTVLDELQADEGTDNLYAVLGSTFHKIMEMHDLFKFNAETLKLYWVPIFYSLISDVLYLSEKTNFKTFLNRGNDIIKNGLELKEKWKHLTIIRNEFYFRLPFPNQYILDVELSGRIDLILFNPEDNTYIILDWKTSKHIDKNIDENVQLAIYIEYIHLTYKVPYENIFACLAYPVSKQIKFTQRTETQIKKLHDKINLALKRISENDFHKEPMMNFQPDDCTFCPHSIKCKN